jgi:P27 family predicted phage terminase small subunit
MLAQIDSWMNAGGRHGNDGAAENGRLRNNREKQFSHNAWSKKARSGHEGPPELGPVARQEWDRIVSELTKLGVLSSFDRGPLAAYCTAYALWLEALEMVQKHDAMIKSSNGFPIQSPYLSHLNKQAGIMVRIASEFGFTPASRSRIFSYSKSNFMLLEIVEKPNYGLPKWGIRIII